MQLSPTVKSFLALIILAVPTMVAVLVAGGTAGPLQVGRARSSVISVKDLDGSLKFYSELGFRKLADTELCARRSETRPVRRPESRPPAGRSFYVVLTSDTKSGPPVSVFQTA